MLTSYIGADQSARNTETTGWLLAIDTSTEAASLALNSGTRSHLASWHSGRRQSTEVLVQIDRLMRSAGILATDLDGVAVALGPGSFTGLRVGLSLGKGFALGARIPIVGIPTLEAIALPWLMAGVSVVAVLPAGRRRLVWQRFDASGAPHPCQSEPMNTTVAEFVAQVAESGIQAIVGEFPDLLLEHQHESDVPLLTTSQLVPRIGAVASLGRYRLDMDDGDDLASLEPIYVHGHAKPANV